MTRYLLAGAVALAMTTGVVFAQGLYPGTTTSQTTTIVPAPALAVPVPVVPGPVLATPFVPVPGGYGTTKTERTVESNGTVIDRTQSYQSGVGGSTVRTTTRTTAPDGSQTSSWREEWTGAPGGTTVTRQTMITQ